MAHGPIPKGLKDALRAGRVVPFVGAGVSMAVKDCDGERLFPSWKALLLQGAARLEDEGKAGEAGLVRALLNVDKPRYLQAAEELHTGLGAHWPPFLKGIFDVPSSAADTASLALARTVWALGSSLVITTNYDDVLKWACPPDKLLDLDFWDIRAPAEQALWLREGTTRKPTVWHLHGRIGNTADLILTPDGYGRLYCGEAESGYRAALETLRHQLAAKSFLFIGFSLDDEHFGVELGGVLDIFEGYAGPHYVLAHQEKVSALKEDVPRGVEVVPYEDYDQLPGLVESFGKLSVASGSKVGKTKPPAPPKDLLDEWLAHVEEEHGRLADCFNRPGRLHLIEEAWVELQVQADQSGPDHGLTVRAHVGRQRFRLARQAFDLGASPGLDARTRPVGHGQVAVGRSAGLGQDHDVASLRAYVGRSPRSGPSAVVRFAVARARSESGLVDRGHGRIPDRGLRRDRGRAAGRGCRWTFGGLARRSRRGAAGASQGCGHVARQAASRVAGVLGGVEHASVGSWHGCLLASLA